MYNYFAVAALTAAVASAFDTAQTHEYTSAGGKGWGYLADDKRTGYYQEEKRDGVYDPAQTFEYTSAGGKGWGYLADDKRRGYYQEEARADDYNSAEETPAADNTAKEATENGEEDENGRRAFDPYQTHVYTQAFDKGRGYLLDDHRAVRYRDDHHPTSRHYDAHWDFEHAIHHAVPDQRFHTSDNYRPHVKEVVPPYTHLSPDGHAVAVEGHLAKVEGFEPHYTKEFHKEYVEPVHAIHETAVHVPPPPVHAAYFDDHEPVEHHVDLAHH